MGTTYICQYVNMSGPFALSLSFRFASSLDARTYHSAEINEEPELVELVLELTERQLLVGFVGDRTKYDANDDEQRAQHIGLGQDLP